MMKISVIVPVFNLENEITKTLESISRQTYQNLEIIVVDDGSTDRSSELLDDYAKTDPRVTVMHTVNSGVTRARLTGVRHATGEYIGFVDGDDLIDADMYEKLAKNAEAYHADISHCGYRLTKGDEVRFYHNTGKLILQDKESGLVDLLEGKIVEPSLCNKLFKKQVIRQALQKQAFDCSIRNNEDLLMNYYFFSFSEKAVFEDFCPYQYLVRDGSASKGKMNGHILFDPVKVARLIYQDSQGNAAVHSAAVGLYAVKLIRAATYYDPDADFDLVPRRKEAQKELKALAPELLSDRSVPLKNKALWLFAAYCPYLYGIVHKAYLKNQ